MIELLEKVEKMDEEEATEYLLKKMESLAIQQDKSRTTTEDEWVLTEEDQNQENEFLATKFNLPKEQLLVTYQANLWQTFPRAGSSYITRNYFIFSSPMIYESIIIPFSDITRINKIGTAQGGVVGGISIETIKLANFQFTVFVRKDEMYNILQQLWKRAMGNMGVSANFVRSQTELRRYGRPDEVVPLEAVRDDLQSVGSKEELRERTKNENFCWRFQVPSTELLYGVVEFKVYKFAYILNADTKTGSGRIVVSSKEGTLYISSSFLCFHSPTLSMDGSSEYDGDLVFVIPLKEIKKTRQAKKPPGSVLSTPFIENKLFTSTSMMRFETAENSHVHANVADACKEFRKEFPDNGSISPALRNLKGRIAHRFDGVVLNDRSQFTRGFHEQQFEIAEGYHKYFEEVGGNISMPHTPLLQRLTRQGIPIWMKSAMWQYLSRSFAIQTTKGKDYYVKLVAQQHEHWLEIAGVADGSKRDEVSKVLDQIERDLHRSLPCQSYYSMKELEGKESEGIQSLRRVLHAFAAHNPHVGYCQSMNIVVAALLMFVDEEECFYLLCAIIQKVPEYYERNMLGSIVDINLFCELMQKKLPKLYQHLIGIHTDVSLIALPWFLTFFIGYVPWEVALRVLDCFFAEGPNILLQVGLAVLKMHQEHLLLIQDVVSVSEYMKDAKFDVEVLCTSAFEEFAFPDQENINALRNFHKMQAIQDLQRRNRSAMIYDLKKSTKFTNTELLTLYEEYKQSINIDSRNHCLQQDQFTELFKHHVPWWPIKIEDKKEWRKLFVIFDTRNERVLSFSQYVRGLDIVLRGLLNAHQKLAFDMFSLNNTLPKENFDEAINLVLSMHSHVNTDVLNKIKAEEFEILGEEKKEEKIGVSGRRLNEIWLHIKEQEHTQTVGESLRNSQKVVLEKKLEEADKEKKEEIEEKLSDSQQSNDSQSLESSQEVPFGLQFMKMTFEQFQISCTLILAESQKDITPPTPVTPSSSTSPSSERVIETKNLTQSPEWDDFEEL